ncbi:hypothetical protein [Blastococcus sp. CCUG 61487]|uniref:hypothetical protein n=1 Tax=Blastococcus sp. CCUG 61487 TaxID=1840703 RepID=UPI0010BFA038|nr:hypothetical protein [Blastococcus sp. CCUG 61487]TKJ20634.1 hypothetical protein A6V29_08255 [Blastococcus sp. CCUG 61487]
MTVLEGGATGRRASVALGRGRRQVLLFLTFVLAAAPIVYVGYREFAVDDPATGGDTGDSAAYARMALTGELDDVPKPFRYRVVVPFLAHLWMRLADRQDLYELYVAFAVLNLVGLALAAWAVHHLLLRWGFTAREGFTGGLLFLASWPVLRFGGAVLVDAWSHAALAGAAYAVVARRYRLLLVVATLGMFVRETTVFAALLVLVVPAPWSVRLRQLACFVPGVVGYALFRFVLAPTEVGYSYNVDRFTRQVTDVLGWSGLPYTLRELALTFGAAGLLFVVGVIHNRRVRALPGSLFWLVPVALVIPFLIASNLARIWFLAFPAVIPLAVLGLRALLADDGERRDEGADSRPAVYAGVPPGTG